MHIGRRVPQLFLAFSFVVLAQPAFAQQVIATVPVGVSPDTQAINPVTNRIYVANACGNDTACNLTSTPYPQGTVTVIDGATNNVLAVINVEYIPYGVAVNSVTNKIYVTNQCGNDPNCVSDGTVSVIDGASNSVIASPTVGSVPYLAPAVNSATNKIYVANICGNDVTCNTYNGTVSVIDGASDTVTATVDVGKSPNPPAVNSATNKIYVSNPCGNDPTCAYGYPYAQGTVTVIDGVTNMTQTVTVGIFPFALDINSATNKIYVANYCGADLNCNGTGTMTVIDGATLGTTDVALGGYRPEGIAVNSSTNKIYVPSDCNGDPSCQDEPTGTVSVVDGGTLTYSSVPVGRKPLAVAINSATNKVYVANFCGNGGPCTGHSGNTIGTVSVIDGATLAYTNLFVGSRPYDLVLDQATDRVYVPNICSNDPACQTRSGTVSVIDGTPPTALQFVPLSQPCRAVDTRPGSGGGGPIQRGTFQNFAISGEGACAVLPSAAAYSMNLTVVPATGSLGYLTVWPAGQPRPLVSTLNSLDGRIKADAAIVPAGANGEVSIYVTDTTNVIVDVNGYFAPATSSMLAFYPLPPCRVADTRHDNYPPGLGPPFLTGGQQRDFPILNAASCNIPSSAAAYSLNFTVVPHGGLSFLTVWPTGQTRPTVSTLNDTLGQVIANAAIVVAGASGEVSAYPTNDTDLIIDIDGYFAPAGAGGLSLYSVTPCRVIDTRNGRGAFTGTLGSPVDVVDTGCAASSLAQAYAFNATVVPVGSLGFLTLWPDGINQPTVSTLNALDGSITNNMAIVPTNNGMIDAYAGNGLTQLILDISSYFAP